MVVNFIKKQIKTKKVNQKRVINIKKLIKVYYRRVGKVKKVAKGVQKNSLTAANIAYKKILKKFN